MNILFVLADSTQQSNLTGDEARIRIDDSLKTELQHEHPVSRKEKTGSLMISNGLPDGIQFEIWVVGPNPEGQSELPLIQHILPQNIQNEALKDRSLYDILASFVHKYLGLYASCHEKSARKKLLPGGREFLTPTEDKIMSLIAAGKTTKSIASEMYISHETVRKHIQNIFHKMNVNSRISALNIWKSINY